MISSNCIYIFINKRINHLFDYYLSISTFVYDPYSLDNIDVFGFDYDYTLASYSEKVQHFIYDKCLEWMIQKQKYPGALTYQCKYDPNFAIRVTIHMSQSCFYMDR